MREVCRLLACCCEDGGSKTVSCWLGERAGQMQARLADQLTNSEGTEQNVGEPGGIIKTEIQKYGIKNQTWLALLFGLR